MTPLETLKAARTRIQMPDLWCQGSFYADRERRCCASGALMEFGCEGMTDPAYIALSQAMGEIQVCQFNDSHEHAEVLAAFDAAIAKLEASDEA